MYLILELSSRTSLHFDVFDLMFFWNCGVLDAYVFFWSSYIKDYWFLEAKLFQLYEMVFF